ncbi:MAG: FtsX-like permease family protein, partial [Bifidobacteriaceae bacterium]|nr:FtsX-like permease family protein [Bifidobacteriaceae bacterium]
LEAATAKNAGYRVGATAKVLTEAGLVEVTVVGIQELEASMMGASLVFIDSAWAEELYGLTGMVYSIAVAGQAGVSQQALVDSVNAALPGDSQAQAITGQQFRQEAKDAIAGILGFVNSFLLIFAAIALFVGAFIIANTFAMTVRERMGEYALLRAMGASPRQVFALVVVQAAIVGVIGALLGLLGGIGLMEVIRLVMDRMGSPLTGSMVPTVGTAATAIVVGVLVTVVGAALPARRAATVAPVEVMREREGASSKGLGLRTAIGAVVLGAGVGLVVAGCWNVDKPHAAWVGYGAVGVVLGALLVSPALVSAITWLLAWPFMGLKPMGRFARGNVGRNPRRSATTGSALMIGVALVSASSVFAATMDRSLGDVLNSMFKADVVVEDAVTYSGVPQELEDALRALPEVGHMSSVYYALAYTQIDGEAQAAPVVALDCDAFGVEFVAEVEQGSWDICETGGLAAPAKIARDNGWELGDTVTVESDFGAVTAQIGAIYPFQFTGEALAGGPAVVQQLLDDPSSARPLFMMIKAAGGVPVDRLEAAVAAVVAPYVVYAVETQEELVKSRSDQVKSMLNMLYALLALSVVIAVLGIINTLALSLIERTREVGLLRAVGLSRGQLRLTIIIESVLIALFGTLTGVVVGAGLAATLPRLLADQGLSLLAIPWGTLASMLVLATVVGVGAALWPAGRAAKKPVLEAIQAA